MLAQLEMIVLKIFSGPQVGGEAVLPPGEYLLGRDASCDIVIDDVLVEPQHCRLIITDDSVELESLGAPIYVESQLFERGRVELFDYIMIGGSCFALGSTQSQWPARPLPELRRHDASPSPTAANSSSPAALPSEFQGNSHTASNNSTQDSGDLEPSAAASRLSLTWICLMACLISLVTLLFFAASSGQSSQSNEVLAQAQPLEQPLEQRLWEMARGQAFESDIRIEKSARGWTVIGYLDKRAERQRLFEEFRKVLPATAIKLWDSESLAESAQGVLNGLHVPLTAAAGKAGTVTIAGTVKSLDQWQSARQRIMRDISAIRQLEDQAVTTVEPKTTSESPRQIAVESVPATAKQPGDSTIEADRTRVPTVDATPPQAAPATIVRNVYLLSADAEAPPRPNPNIRSVSVGASQSLVTAEGTRVMKGGRLDGWMVMEIAADKIVLERGKYRHIVDLLMP